MKRLLLPAITLLAALAGGYAGIAVAAGDTAVPIDTLVVTIDGSSGLTPKLLSRSAYTPVGLTVAGSIRDLDPAEPQPPPLKEVLLDVKNLAADTRGYPVCSGGMRDFRSAQDVEHACGNSIVGVGTTTLSIKFPEEEAMVATIPLLVFNGGSVGGTTTLYIYAYLTQPITTAIVIPIKIEKAGNGVKSVATVPKIANGAGSVTDFALKIDKKFTYKGKKHSVLSAKCVGGKSRVHVVSKFYDGSEVAADVLRTCTSRR
jgi:hypothetical protein